MIKTLGFISSGLLVLSLTACGGGNNNAPPITDSGANSGALNSKITDSNARAVATEVMNVGDSLLGAGRVVGDQARSLGTTSPTVGLLSVVQSQVLMILRNIEGSVVPASRAAAGTGLINCGGGGTLSVSFNDQNNNSTFDVGDIVSLGAANCVLVLNESTKLNGAMKITSTRKDGDPTLESSNYAVGASVMMTAFSISDSQSGTFTHNGEISFLVTHAPNTESVEVSAPNLTIIDNSVTNLLSNFKVSTTDDLATGQWVIALSGGVVNSANGAFRLSSTSPLRGVGGGNPTGGQLRIDGVDSSVTIVPQSDGTHVRLDVDSNGDLITDTTINTTWEEFDAIL